MEVVIFIMYIIILLYGIGAFFQKSAVARLIASCVMMAAMVLHSCMMILLFGAGLTVFGAAWFTTAASGNTTESDVAAIEASGADVASGATTLFELMCVFALVLIGFALAHFVVGILLTVKQRSKPKSSPLTVLAE